MRLLLSRLLETLFQKKNNIDGDFHSSYGRLMNSMSTPVILVKAVIILEFIDLIILKNDKSSGIPQLLALISV